MTRRQYQVILDLFHEFNVAYWQVSEEIRNEFQDILMGRKSPVDGE